MIVGVVAALHLMAWAGLDGARAPDAPSHLGVGAQVQAPFGYLKFCLRRPDQCATSPLAPIDAAAGRPATRLLQTAALPQTPSLPQGAALLDPQATGEGREAASARVGGSSAAPSAGEGRAFAAAVGDRPGRPVLTTDRRRLLERVNRSLNERIRPMTDERAFGVSNYWTLPIEDEHVNAGNCKHYALEKRKALIDAGWPAESLSLALVKTAQGELHAVLVASTSEVDLVLDNLRSQPVDWRTLDYRWLVRQTPGEPLKWVAVAPG